MRLVENRHGNVAVVNGQRVGRPVVVALLPALLDATRQHDNGPAVALPDHPPKVVPRRVQWPLRHDEFSRRIVTLCTRAKSSDIQIPSFSHSLGTDSSTRGKVEVFLANSALRRRIARKSFKCRTIIN